MLTNKELNSMGLTFSNPNIEYIKFIKNMGDINNQEYKKNVEFIILKLNNKFLIKLLSSGDYGNLYDALKKYNSE